METTEDKRKARIAQLEAKLQKEKARQKADAKKNEAKIYIPTGKKTLETLRAVGYPRRPDVAVELAPKMIALGAFLLDFFKSLSLAERMAWIAKADAMHKGVAADVLRAAQAQYDAAQARAQTKIEETQGGEGEGEEERMW